MNAWGIFLQLLAVVVALALGGSLATQGIAQGKAFGGMDVTILGRRFLLSTRQVYVGKVWFRAAIVAA